MNSNEASSCDYKVTFLWLQTLKSMVSGFAKIVVEQAADFCKWFLVLMGTDL